MEKVELKVDNEHLIQFSISTSTMIRLSIIVAATTTNGIGKNGRLPWCIHEDMKYFMRVTQNAPEGTQNAVSWVERLGRASQPSTGLYQSVLISLLAITQITHCMVI